jgi:hypothetical protein
MECVSTHATGRLAEINLPFRVTSPAPRQISVDDHSVISAITRKKEVDMRSLKRKSVLLAGAFLLLASATANAAVSDVLEVKIPFAFVASGKQFPAGQYMIQPDESTPNVLLLRGENGNRAAAFVLTMAADGRDPKGSVPALTFVRHENQLRLVTVWDSGTEGAAIVGR